MSYSEAPSRAPEVDETPRLEVTGVRKSFGGVPALIDVSFSLQAGCVLGVVGENGAGKSTLMKVVAGIYPEGTYTGTITLDGEIVEFQDVQQARQSGIVLVPQELHIAPDLSIAENMFAGELPQRFGFVDFTGLEKRAKTWLDFFGLNIDADLPASVLSPSEQRIALIAGSLSRHARVLILDEPTASLSDSESEVLFTHIERLKVQGIAILFISHRLDDIARVCDEVLVMRNGSTVRHWAQRDVPRADIVAAMIGRTDSPLDSRSEPTLGKTMLEVRELSVPDPTNPARLRANKVSFSVRGGEILGLFGLVGAGRTEILRAIFGTWPASASGTISVDGATYVPSAPRQAIQRGIAMITEDRKQTGIFFGHSLLSNIDAASIKDVAKSGVVRQTYDEHRAAALLQRIDVRARSITQPIETLSGGNQQKVLLGRWLATKPRVLFLDEPTAGVDVGAREEIYRQIEELADGGCAVLLVSSDLDEVMRISDRTLVMYKSQIRAEFTEQPTKHALMDAATGGR